MAENNIIALLESAESEDIREGAYLAGSERLEKAVPLLIRHIQNPDIGVQEAADRALRKIGGPGVACAAIPLLGSEDAPVRNIAMDLLREVGVTAISALVALLHDQNVDMRIFASDILGSTGSVLAVGPLSDAMLRDPEVNVRYQAAVSLGALAFPEAAPSLNKALNDEEWVQFSVIEALIKIRAESSVAALVKALDTSSDLVASVIVDALGEMGNIKAAPLLLRRLANTTGPLRNKIVASIVKILGEKFLGLLAPKERENLRTYMLVAIKDDDEDVQDAVVRGLGVMKGDKASEAIAALAVTLDPEREHERLECMLDILGRIGLTPTVTALVRDGSELGQHIGVEVLSRNPSRQGVDFMKSIFWEKPRDLQRSIILVLARQCQPEDQAFFLNILEKHTDGDVLKAALLFLGRKGEPKDVSEAVTSFLEHPYNDVKEAALDACIALHDPITVGYILGMVDEEMPFRRMMAVYALGSMDLAAYGHIILKALDDSDSDVRRVAIESLGRNCPLPQKYRDAIAEKLDDAESEIRLTALAVFAKCNDICLEKCLLRGLDDPDQWMRVRCIEILGGRRMVSAVPRLVELLAEENELIVIKTVEALGSIGGEAAFGSLISLMDHGNPDIQHAAEEAVERIRESEGNS